MLGPLGDCKLRERGPFPRGPVVHALIAAVVGLMSAGISTRPIAAQCVRPDPVPQSQPANLGQLKLELTYYQCSGLYDREIAQILKRVRGYVERRVSENAKRSGAQRQNLALVLDIDETSLSNWLALKADDFGFFAHGSCPLTPNDPCGFDDWIGQHKAPAIAPTLELFNVAKAHGVAVFFVSSRREDQRQATIENLKAVGYDGWHDVMLRAQGDPSSVQQYKTAKRQAIEKSGFRIIANVGDQLSDLRGGHAEEVFKLPNPFYLVPADKKAGPGR